MHVIIDMTLDMHICDRSTYKKRSDFGIEKELKTHKHKLFFFLAKQMPQVYTLCCGT